MLDASTNSDADIITFQDGLTGVITLLSPLPQITTDLTVVGSGANLVTISGSQLYRIFDVAYSAKLTVSGFTLIGGKAVSGGAILVGPNAVLDVSDMVFTQNTATYGGAISGTSINHVTVHNSEFTGNQAKKGDGGAISINGGNLFISNSRFNNNKAMVAGAIRIGFGFAMISGSTISNNRASRHAGALHTNVATLHLTSSTFDGNRAGTAGGAYYAEHLSEVIISNSTFTNNHAGTTGGFLFADPHDPGWDIQINHSTVSGNSAGVSAGGIRRNSQVLALRNSIVAGNTAPSAPDISGKITSHGYNLIGDSTGSKFGRVVGDIVGSAASRINPRLQPLADNGGPTLTMMPNANSPAVNVIPSHLASYCNQFYAGDDQRGVSRTQEYLCDIGAIEFVSLPPANDNFTAAHTITSDIFHDSQPKFHLATAEAEDPVHECRIDGPQQGAASVWYSFTPTTSASLDIDTYWSSGSAQNTVLSIFTGDPGSFTSVACNDDYSDTNQSSILTDVPLTAGIPYSILISSWSATAPDALGNLVVRFAFSDGGTDLLQGGGFEVDINNDNKPDMWGLKNVSGDKRECNPAISQSGRCAMRLKGSPSEALKLTHVIQYPDTAQFSNGDMLTLSAYFNGSNPTAKTTLKLTVQYGSTPSQKSKLKVGPSNGYARFATNPLPLNSVMLEKIVVTITHTSMRGKIYMDTVSLIHTPIGLRNRQADAPLSVPALPDSFRGSN